MFEGNVSVADSLIISASGLLVVFGVLVSLSLSTVIIAGIIKFFSKEKPEPTKSAGIAPMLAENKPTTLLAALHGALSLASGIRIDGLVITSVKKLAEDNNNFERGISDMKYKAIINGEQFEVEIEPIGSQAPVLAKEPARLPAPVTITNPTPAISRPPVKPQPPKPTATVSADENAITSPMPGTVFGVEVAPGDSVADGQTVVILEAMKMEIEIKAHKNGTVSSVPAKKGDVVETGTPLVIL